VLERQARELEMLKRDTTKLENVRPPFPRISYEDAIGGFCRKRQSRQVRRWATNFGGDEEQSSRKSLTVLVLIYIIADRDE